MARRRVSPSAIAVIVSGYHHKSAEKFETGAGIPWARTCSKKHDQALHVVTEALAKTSLFTTAAWDDVCCLGKNTVHCTLSKYFSPELQSQAQGPWLNTAACAL